MLSSLTRSQSQSIRQEMEHMRIGHPWSPTKGYPSNDRTSTAPVPTENSGFVQTLVTRSNNRYEFAFPVEGEETTLALIAEKKTKMLKNKYQIFDAMRGGANSKLAKKSGHYVGVLRREKEYQGQACYTLCDSSREKGQLAAFVYDIPNIVSQVREGQPPRKMQAVLPDEASKLPNDGTSSVKTNHNRLAEHLHNGTWQHHDLVVLRTRAPSFYEGQYRLNFQGRVLTPSVKNMQLENQTSVIVLQFGKVDDTRFHLDFKAPFTVVTAFATALAQFDLLTSFIVTAY